MFERIKAAWRAFRGGCCRNHPEPKYHPTAIPPPTIEKKPEREPREFTYEKRQ